MTSDKFVYLFGEIIPALSLIFSMVLRLVPRLKAQSRVIANARKVSAATQAAALSCSGRAAWCRSFDDDHRGVGVSD
jgi:hypothetical protein